MSSYSARRPRPQSAAAGAPLRAPVARSDSGGAAAGGSRGPSELDAADIAGLALARRALEEQLHALRGRLAALPPKSAAPAPTARATRTFTLEDSKTVFLITPVPYAARRRCVERHGEFNTSYVSHMTPSTFVWDPTYSSESRCGRVRVDRKSVV